MENLCGNNACDSSYGESCSVCSLDCGVCVTPTTPVTSSGGGGGGGGNVLNGTVIVINESELSAGTENALGVGDIARFDLSEDSGVSEQHSLSVTSVDEAENSVDIVIQSTPQNAKLVVGTPEKFELDGDGYYDVRVSLNSIKNNRAYIGVGRIVENVLTGEGAIHSENGEIISQDSSSSKRNYFWVIMIGSIILALGLIVWTLTRINKYRSNAEVK